ncbi:MAG: hypothetical protein OXF33_03145, partial [Rhodospirillales bacterium]|nr:hypothetical protein [Rhodospirillales bacterium]
EAAAAAFRRGSRATGQNRSLCKALTLQAFPPVHAMAVAGRKSITDEWGVPSQLPQEVGMTLCAALRCRFLMAAADRVRSPSGA